MNPLPDQQAQAQPGTAAYDDFDEICAQCGSSKGEHQADTWRCPDYAVPGDERSVLYGFRSTRFISRQVHPYNKPTWDDWGNPTNDAAQRLEDDELETPTPTPPPLQSRLVEAVESGLTDPDVDAAVDRIKIDYPGETVFSVVVHGPDEWGNFVVRTCNPDGSTATEIVCNQNNLAHELRNAHAALLDCYDTWATEREERP